MKTHVETFLAAINFAWDELFDFRWQLIVKNSAPLKHDNNFTFAAFPLLGFAAGLVVSLISLMVSGIFNINSGALVFAVLSWALLCFKDSGRGDCWLANFFLGKLQTAENHDLLRSILNLFPMMLKFIILLFIGLAGNMLCFPILLATAFALQAALAGSDDCPVEFIPADENAKGGGQCYTGGDNEIWSYGDTAFEIFKRLIALRERMKPYITAAMDEAHEKGTPPMRPLFYDFPSDTHAWEIEDEYIFGSSVLVAPISYEGATEREVYLPAGCDWICVKDGKKYAGGTTLNVTAQLDEIPLYVRADSNIDYKEFRY